MKIASKPVYVKTVTLVKKQCSFCFCFMCFPPPYFWCVLVLYPNTGPWHPNSTLFVLPYELRKFTYDVVARCLAGVYF